MLARGWRPNLPTLIDTTYTNPAGSTIVVGGGGDFQAALNSANPGDKITLNAGSNYTGTFTLPVKSGSTDIYIVSSALGSLPAAESRVAIADATNMPKIVGPSPTEPALVCAAAAHHFRFVGCEFKSETGEANNGLVRLGTGSEVATSEFPHHIILDRCIVRGDSTAGGRRGVLLAGNYLAIVDSYLYDWKLSGSESQAIAGWTGEGPWSIKNNYIEAAAEGMLVGGSDPFISNLIPSDIEVRGNLFSKPLIWNPFHPSYDSSTWMVKNAFELKFARRVLIIDNIFEHNWVAAQSGRIVLFTTKNDVGGVWWAVIEDVTFTRNIINGSHSGITISGNDGGFPSLGGRRIRINDNFFVDMGGADWGDAQAPDFTPSVMFALTGGMPYCTIDHNTIIHGPFDGEGNFISADGTAYENFRLTNNICEHNFYGIKGNGTAIGNDTLTTYFPGAIVEKNLFVGGVASSYPANNYFPTSLAGVGFEDIPDDYRLDELGDPITGTLMTSLTPFWELANANDSASTNHLTAVNSPSFSAEGVDLEDSSIQYLTIADNAALRTGDVSFTFNVWVKAESLSGSSGFPFIAGKGWLSDANANQEWAVFQNGAGNPLAFAVGHSTSNTVLENSSGGVLNAGTWNMVTVWHDATNNLIGIALNAGTPDTQAHASGVNSGDRSFVLGARSDGSLPFDGFIRRAGFWKGRVLTAAERTELFNVGNGLSFSGMSSGTFGISPYVGVATDGLSIGASNEVIEALA